MEGDFQAKSTFQDKPHLNYVPVVFHKCPKRVMFQSVGNTAGDAACSISTEARKSAEFNDHHGCVSVYVSLVLFLALFQNLVCCLTAYIGSWLHRKHPNGHGIS